MMEGLLRQLNQEFSPVFQAEPNQITTMMPPRLPSPIGLFGPSEVQAEVLPDPEIKNMMKEMLVEGGIPASTLRAAMNFPEYVQVTRSKEIWDRYINGLVGTFSDEDIIKYGYQSRESLKEKLRQRMGGKYYSQDPGEMSEKEKREAWNRDYNLFGRRMGEVNYGGFPITIVSPDPPMFERMKDPKKIIAHELGHFLIDRTGFRSVLKEQKIDEERLADFLGGFPVREPEKIRSLASALFQRALQIQQGQKQ